MSAAIPPGDRLIRSLRRATWVAGTLWALALAPSIARAAEDLVLRQRIDEARQWERKGRDDLATDIWQRILVLDPQNKTAQAALGRIEARAGHRAPPAVRAAPRELAPETDVVVTTPRTARPASPEEPRTDDPGPVREGRKKRRDRSSRPTAPPSRADAPGPRALPTASAETADPVFDPSHAAVSPSGVTIHPTTLLAPSVALVTPKIPLPADLLVAPEFMPDPLPPAPSDPAQRPRPWSNPSREPTK